MKNLTAIVTLLAAIITLLLSGRSVSAQTCKEKHDACLAQCSQGNTAQRKSCIRKCNDEFDACVKKTSTRPQPLDLTKDVEIGACLEGGAPCRQSVRKICTLMTGACDDCWKSLCGGGDFSFGSSLSLNVKLMAATDAVKGGRVLATSSMKGKQALLRVPADIKLNDKEELYFEFSSKEKPTGPVQVHIHRGG
ncbi:MAG TPA: hypothetical protein VLO30_00845 [Chthoniobacterales bacterium]|nr:hypothetical protein [Chthoniobacterales bacterium]